MMAFRIAELERRLSNLLRVGTVAELNEVTARVRVNMAGTKSAWLPWLTQRAGEDRTWWAPEPGEQVMVFSPYGDTAQAVVMPAIYQDAHPAPGNVKTVHRTVYADGTAIAYDRAHSTLTVDCVGEVVVNAATKVTVQTPEVLVDSPMTTFTGQVLVQGLLTYAAGIVGTGAAAGGGAGAVIAGKVQVVGGDIELDTGDVKADDITLKTHRHPENGDTITSAPIP